MGGVRVAYLVLVCLLVGIHIPTATAELGTKDNPKPAFLGVNEGVIESTDDIFYFNYNTSAAYRYQISLNAAEQTNYKFIVHDQSMSYIRSASGNDYPKTLRFQGIEKSLYIGVISNSGTGDFDLSIEILAPFNPISYAIASTELQRGDTYQWSITSLSNGEPDEYDGGIISVTMAQDGMDMRFSQPLQSSLDDQLDLVVTGVKSKDFLYSFRYLLLPTNFVLENGTSIDLLTYLNNYELILSINDIGIETFELIGNELVYSSLFESPSFNITITEEVRFDSKTGLLNSYSYFYDRYYLYLREQTQYFISYTFMGVQRSDSSTVQINSQPEQIFKLPAPSILSMFAIPILLRKKYGNT